MRKVIYGGACSLDGYLTGRDGAVDWLRFSADVEAIMRQSWAAADTVLLGRKTWEWSRAHAAEAPDDPSLTAIKSYVFSRTLATIPDKNAELVRGDAGAFVRTLKSQPGKNILVMSGGDFATSLLKAGVIDEIGLNIHPLLLGSGAPAFLDPGERVTLELTECRQLEGGCVFVRYAVRP